MRLYLKYLFESGDTSLTVHKNKPSEELGYKIITKTIKPKFIKNNNLFFKWVLDDDYEFVPIQVNGNTIEIEIVNELQRIIDDETFLCEGKTTNDFTSVIRQRGIYNENGSECFTLEYNFKEYSNPSMKYLSSTFWSFYVPLPTE